MTPGPEPTDVPDLPGAVDVDLLTEDDLSLEGLLFGEGRKAGVVLVHASDADGSSWYPFAGRLFAAGYSALAFDLRGYGRSEGDRNPAQHPLDVAEAIEFLIDSGTERVAVVGVEVGGTAAVAGVQKTEEPVAAVVTVNAGPVFEGLDATGAARRLRADTLVVRAGNAEAERLAALVKGSTLKSARTASTQDSDLQDLILGFLRPRLRV